MVKLDRYEFVLHLMHDYIKVRNFWCYLVNGRYFSSFFSDNVLTWVHVNLRPNKYFSDSWEDDAAIAIRVQTKMHNIIICESFDKSLMKDIMTLLTPFFVKINSDEIVYTTNKEAMCRLVIRDHSFMYMLKYSTYIRPCSITLAELWDIKKGLTLACTTRLTNVCIELDSKVILNLITIGCTSSLSCYNLVSNIKKHFSLKIYGVLLPYLS
ncbi:hypothetical protein CR513_47558, partial [Mucuna pruriens]